MQPLLAPLLVYLQAAVLALSGGFLMHLLLRAIWVAMVGMRSVDPTGSVRHSKSLGPWQRERVSALWDCLPQRIAALDDNATVVFAVALGLARLMAQLFVYASIAVLLSLLVGLVSGGRLPPIVAFAFLVLALVLPLLVVVAIDNRAGRRNLPTPRAAQRGLEIYDRLAMTAQHNLALQLVVHRIAADGGRNRGTLAVVGIMMALMIATTILPIMLRGEWAFFLRAGFPQLAIGDAQTMRGAHYDDRAAGPLARRLPSIPGPQVADPWLRVFIPWVDEWHGEPLRECSAPRGTRWRAEAETARATLACIAARQAITLDGVPVTAPWLLADDLLRNRRGFQLMIDIRALAVGAHELTIQSPAEREADAPIEVWRIPFWN